MSSGDVLLAVTTISFDIAGLELYLPLISGGTIALAGRDEAADGRRLRDLLVRVQPSIMQATPATWRGLIDAGWTAGETPALRVFCGGEALPRDLADELLARAAEVWNLYGPTETTIWSTVHRVTKTDGVPIGVPIANTRVYVLDPSGAPTPPGVPGELFIGGDGVAKGYLNRPELTAERFVPDPFDVTAGARMYRTGDRARFRADGRLEHLGRLDHQIKLRGYRIELGEIESALGALAAVGHAVAEVRGDRLVAYVVFAKGEELTASEIRASLRDTLPDYMIPSLVVPLDALPLTPNGKVDRRALPDPLRATVRAAVEYVAPATPTEVAIADVWRLVLGVDRVSTGDNFFELGGHSLLSIRAVQEIQQRTGWRPDPRLLFFETLGRIASARFEAAR
jgi:acyl-CoA synthetase (AMP-forming)/AMP-acid ligase II